MLRFKRPMGSRTEHNFRKYFLLNLPDMWEDNWGNLHCVIANKQGEWPQVIWSSHTDTVHDEDGYQKIQYKQGVVSLAPGETSNCLGADCTVGVWIMREMILAGIPGHYIFHWGEERGCKGSGDVVKHNPEYFKHAKAVIAFDRKGNGSVITHQKSLRTCSDIFADSLAAMLPREYKKDDTGVYTDSAEYAELVSECTNLSVGFKREHHENESLDLSVPVKLLTSILKNWDERNLLFVRDPKVIERKSYTTIMGPTSNKFDHSKYGNYWLWDAETNSYLSLDDQRKKDDEKLGFSWGH